MFEACLVEVTFSLGRIHGTTFTLGQRAPEEPSFVALVKSPWLVDFRDSWTRLPEISRAFEPHLNWSTSTSPSLYISPPSYLQGDFYRPDTSWSTTPNKLVCNPHQHPSTTLISTFTQPVTSHVMSFFWNLPLRFRSVEAPAGSLRHISQPCLIGP